MARSRLTQKLKLYDWYKFSKAYKKKYKEENGEPLRVNTAVYITFYKILKSSLLGTGSKAGLKEPEIEDVIERIKLQNNNCSDEVAIDILNTYNEDPNALGYAGGGSLIGAMLDMNVDFYTDLQISKDSLKRAIELRQLYIDSLEQKKQEQKEPDSKENSDTQ